MAVGRTNATSPGVSGKNASYTVYTGNTIAKGDLVQLAVYGGTAYVIKYTGGEVVYAGGVALTDASAGTTCLIRVPTEVTLP